MTDFIVVGSGPAGVITTHRLLEAGHRVTLIDAGACADNTVIKTDHFLNQKDPQNAFFYAPEDNVTDSHAGNAQLTNARAHMLHSVQAELPLESDTFLPTQTLAQGGLSAAWGAACFTYGSDELAKASISATHEDYEEVAVMIGISGPSKSHFCKLPNKQPVATVDHNAQSILSIFNKKKSTEAFTLEASSLAMLTEPLNNRQANAYHDMDFYSNFGDSVFRADVLLQTFKGNVLFTHVQGFIALRYDEVDEQVRLECKNLKTTEIEKFSANKLIITCGALNSYRLVANSKGIFDQENPLLCNPYIYVPTLHLPSLGKAGAYKRHSLSQVFGELVTKTQKLTLQFYSYRSLLLSRLMIQTPMTPYFARLFWRSIVEALVIVGVHYPDDGKSKRSITIKQSKHAHDLPSLQVDFPFAAHLDVWAIFKKLLCLKCLPMGFVKTQMGGSIHYAGTMPVDRPDLPISLTADGQVVGSKNIYVFDSSGWTQLPSRGLTFTIMAAANRLAKKLIESKRR